MNTNDISMTVIGAGSYGTALAIALARNGHKVVLWGRNTPHIQELQRVRYNQTLLPDVSFPKNLLLESNLAQALAGSRNVLVVVPSHCFKNVLKQLQPHLHADARIVWASKGLETERGCLLQQVAQEVVGKSVPLAIISGPTFAKELAAGLPTAITLASKDDGFRQDLERLFHCGKSLLVYSSTDVIGVQLGGVVKNVIAIGAGISDGLGFGANARAALITRGLTEMSHLGIALGADAATFMGMAGLGDLVLTCTDNQSRNRRFGIEIGQGCSVQQAQTKIGQLVEGYRNTQEVSVLAKRYAVRMPITEQIYQVLYCDKKASEAASTLLEGC
ncbi:NAD(P)H-dependent glycerol-3-phosphate dehydrogenase [Candidatus Fukatsuia symbiotica]|uniref:NAD(P)H-dependent glycerol-3-phosphate dehydrogenase n=1 Tax=Candidatus Fukatsuia TaxID=1927833 RepID=UPI000E719187|nr:NAD(P)H-dependent glycerol-3-phosphate dehydrogenase [Candidatus Fukatsuia symbiotica]MEA9445790.1 NAD(P)H-dependent glycerol-3-phosphate dehydrogenase [Candidatus Fukatsuia symbiotica]